MSADAYRRAERCFALARSTSFPGERSAAIARGTAIATKAGLSLDSFDIPGRVRALGAERLFEGSGIFGDNFEYVRPVVGRSVDDIFAEINRHLREAARNQYRDVEAERQRRWQRRVDEAVDFLRARGNVVRRVEGGYLLDGSGVMAETVVREAKARGWRG